MAKGDPGVGLSSDPEDFRTKVGDGGDFTAVVGQDERPPGSEKGL
jgi:hypothetical protein